MGNIVKDWFGESFNKLDPLFQELHLRGGDLSGKVSLKYGSGMGGVIGRKLGVKLGLPLKEGDYEFEVNIYHQDQKLYWIRKFDKKYSMTSIFEPYGRYPMGYWRETIGLITLELGVDVLQGGWYWVQKNIKLMGVDMPRFLFPKSNAYKRVNNGKYEFSVTLTSTLFGTLLSYSGLLTES